MYMCVYCRFSVSVQRENFPPDTNEQVQPAHTLTLHPPLTLTNLLPCDIQFYLLSSKVRKFIKRGKEIAIYSVSAKAAMRCELGFALL